MGNRGGASPKEDASLSTTYYGNIASSCFTLRCFTLLLTLLLAGALSEFSSDGFREALFELS
jgi:hypothetical protein